MTGHSEETSRDGDRQLIVTDKSINQNIVLSRHVARESEGHDDDENKVECLQPPWAASKTKIVQFSVSVSRDSGCLSQYSLCL